MTTSAAQEVASRRSRRAGTRPKTLARDLLEVLRDELAKQDSEHTWPSAKYREDPVGFCTEVLGLKLWAKQREILEAMVVHKRIAVVSGHKIGKSTTAAAAALWFYCSFPDARVVMSSATSRQVDAILWRELRKLKAKAKHDIDGDMHELARSGLKALDLREVVGFTAKDAEAVAGVSGANVLYLVDEASGVADPMFEAIEGNRAGGGRVVMFSNPTRTTGEFFEAFHAKADLYFTIQVSSEETPNVVEGRDVYPGLANREWVEEKRIEWGSVDASGSFVPGPLYKVRVRGEFVLNEEGRVISLHLIEEAEQRWHELGEDGRLVIGIDPAGPGLGGDESVFAVRRGKKILALYAFRGLSDEGHIVNLRGLLKEHARPREEAPAVHIDREGPIGATIYGLLRATAERDGFEVRGIRSSERARRAPDRFERVRDELWWNLGEWLRDGGAIPEDTKLAKELHAPEWETTVTGRIKATAKSELRTALERSPDRADACALACWTPLERDLASSRVEGAAPGAPAPQARATVVANYRHTGGSDPHRGGIDPYGGR